MKKRSLHIMLLFIATAALQTPSTIMAMDQDEEEEIDQSWANAIRYAILYKQRDRKLVFSSSAAGALGAPLRTAIDNGDLDSLQRELDHVERSNLGHRTEVCVQAMDYALEKDDEGEFARKFFDSSPTHNYQIIQEISNDRILHLMRVVLPYKPCLDYQRFFLEKAIRAQDMYVIRALLDKGFKPDDRDTDRDLPLTLAARTGNYEIARLLREHGAHLHYSNSENRDEPIEVATKRCDKSMLYELIADDPEARRCALKEAKQQYVLAKTWDNLNLISFIRKKSLH